MKSFSLSELASHIQAEVIGDAQTKIHRVAPIAQAISGDIAVIKSKSYLKYASQTQASAIILKKDDADYCKTNALIVDNPELAFIKIIRLFHPEKKFTSFIHPTAVIAKTAKISEKAHIGAYAVIGENTVIADDVVIEAHTTIGDGVVIQKECRIYPNVTIYDGVHIGARVILHSGCVIGADGFGMANNRGKWEKIPQVGSVVIGDDVEIGANSCIDRGALNNTIIESGVKIDNLVMIAHNVHVGANTVIAGSTAIAGSTIIGKHCIIGGAVTIGDHLAICDNVIFTGCAMVTGSVTEPGMYSSGTGLFPSAVWRRVVAKLRRSGMKREE